MHQRRFTVFFSSFLDIFFFAFGENTDDVVIQSTRTLEFCGQFHLHFTCSFEAFKGSFNANSFMPLFRTEYSSLSLTFLVSRHPWSAISVFSGPLHAKRGLKSIKLKTDGTRDRFSRHPSVPRLITTIL